MFVFLLAGSSLMAQVKEKRQVEDFKSIKSSQSIKVNFTYGKTKSVEVDVEDKADLEYVKTTVNSKGVLQISLESKSKKNFTMSSNVIVTISNPTLEGVELSSSSKFNLLNTVKAKSFSVQSSSSSKFTAVLVQADNLMLSASSSSKIEGIFEVINKSTIESSSSATCDFTLKAKDVQIAASSSSLIKIQGTGTSLDAAVSSSANIKGKDFKVKTLSGSASSAGKMAFDVADVVNGKASSSGQILFAGNATIGSSKTSSSGQIKRID